MHTRSPAVAGAFYPSDPQDLDRELDACFTRGVAWSGPAPLALVVPHAGYVYSGPIAASGYATLAPLRGRIRRVALLGPSHRFGFRGFAIPEAEAWSTPLGVVPLDRTALGALATRPDVVASDRIHAQEHSLEVQLPFLQRVLGEFTLLPILFGQVDLSVGEALVQQLWADEATLVVVSTDLSHYHAQDHARRVDAQTVADVESLQAEAVEQSEACGSAPLAALVAAARARGLSLHAIDVRTSADTAGDPSRVVGYASLVATLDDATTAASTDATVFDLHATRFDRDQRRHLCELAHLAIAQRLGLPAPAPLGGCRADAWLREPAAAFVTLDLDGDLRGCIGTTEPHYALGDAIMRHAVAAAFHDPRFPPVTPDEFDRLDLSISVLSPRVAVPWLPRRDLERRLRVGVDGLLLESGSRRATFLPSVWEELSSPAAFVAALLRKAGIGRDEWPANLQISVYTTESWHAVDVA
jgi:AmmeMemoRadiSam system protein B/AmmeMemoRadiSam system protein A